ncbi:MAG TPA: hypothetical protein VKH44_15165, partial [Pirellulaceae bacterium]|nr:hypothetical protein [Pirellulaceae bacterium]
MCAELKRLVALAILVGLILIAGKYYCFDRLNEEIRAEVEKRLRNHYQGLSVTIKSARRIAGRGVEIRGVRIAEAGGRTAPVLAEIDEVFADCDTRLPDFLTKPLQITALHVHRLKLRAERKPSGRWNLSHLLPLPSCQSAAAPVATVSDATLEIVDPTQKPACSLLLRNIELSVAPEATAEAPDMVLRVRGTLAGDHVERVEIDGVLDPVTSRWDVRGAVEGLEFSPRLRAGLPHELSAALAPLWSVRGRTFFGFHAWRAARSAKQPDMAPPLQFVVHGKISEGRIDDARLPEPLTDVEATIRCDNFGVRIDELAARCGPTQIELTAAITGYGGTQPIDMELTARQLRLDDLPVATLSPAAQATWNRFQPQGLADVSGRLQFDGGQWRPDLKIECHDLSLTYDSFPYRVTDGSGTIVVKADALSAGLRLVGGGRFIRCQADVRDPGPNFTGWVHLQSEGPVTIDEKLLGAMDAPTQRLVRGFQPRGSGSFFARFARSPGEAMMHRHLEINLHECSIQHERFPYPIDRVNGTLAADDETWTFKNLVGRNDSAEIACEGSWGEQGKAGRRLRLQFTAGDVPLADELRQALPQSAQGLWSNLRPRGNIDRLEVDLQYASATQRWSIDCAAQKWLPASGGEGRSISFEPAWFRYALNNVTGGFRYRDGRMELSNLRATHGRAN